MRWLQSQNVRREIGWFAGCLWAIVSVLSFQCAQHWAYGWLTLLCGYGLIELGRLPTPRKAFYFSFLAGYLFYAPQLGFFWRIFHFGAIVLWLILAVWVGLFGLLLRLVHTRFGETAMLIAVPFVWTGLEYFRSELYYLRFAWLTLGMAFSSSPGMVSGIGVYGLGFLCMAIAAMLNWLRRFGKAPALVMLAILISLLHFMSPSGSELAQSSGKGIPVAGVQLEFANQAVILDRLNQLLRKRPQTRLVMLSEYSFEGTIPQPIRNWCRENHRYLVAGGKQWLGQTNFYDMAYVVGPDGRIVFRQAKSVPLQFFKDGLPAPEQRVWKSPWGRLGILICYDLSYSRVVDRLVRQGARALLVPTMDVSEWGRHEHVLSARVAPLRAAEYGLPIFRVCSSGISQLVNASGQVTAGAPFPGVAAPISGTLTLAQHPHLPLDRFLSPVCVGIVALLAAGFILCRFLDKRQRRTGERRSVSPKNGDWTAAPPGPDASHSDGERTRPAG